MSSSTFESRTSRAASRIADFWQAALASLVKRRIAQIRSNLQVRRRINALLALDDRMLADIGLTRGAVEYAARHGHVPAGSTRGYGEIGRAAENLKNCPIDRIPTLKAGKHRALSIVLIAEVSFAACAMVVTEPRAEAVVDEARVPAASIELTLRSLC
jgi:uncharacterized protein YjiS (DUF1127 family)